MNFETVEKLPVSMGANVTAVPEFITTEKSETTVNKDGTLENTISTDEALKAADHTKISPLSIDSKTGTTGQPIAGASATLGSMLEAKLAIELIDSVLPGMLVAAFHAMDIKMKKAELQLTEKEKQTIAPIFQKCLDTIYLNFNSPWTLLAVTVGVIYGGKVTEKGIVAYIDKKNAKTDKIEPVNVITTAPGNGSPASDISNQPANVIMNNINSDPGKWSITDERIKAVMRIRKVTQKKAIEIMENWKKQRKIFPYEL
jgi:hypothetical protein